MSRLGKFRRTSGRWQLMQIHRPSASEAPLPAAPLPHLCRNEPCSRKAVPDEVQVHTVLMIIHGFSLSPLDLHTVDLLNVRYSNSNTDDV